MLHNKKIYITRYITAYIVIYSITKNLPAPLAPFTVALRVPGLLPLRYPAWEHWQLEVGKLALLPLALA